jgi:hypothetical protein
VIGDRRYRLRADLGNRKPRAERDVAAPVILAATFLGPMIAFGAAFLVAVLAGNF